MQPLPFIGFADPLSSWSHLLAAGAALVGWFFLLKKGHGNSIRFLSLSLFSFSLVFLFSMSGVFHLLSYNTVSRLVLQKLDHAAIWVLIAGTFTPIHAILFRGIWRWGFLSLVWIIAITGLTLQVIFFREIPEWLNLSFYLTLGWMGFFTGLKCTRDYGLKSAKFLILGGMAYSIGALIDFFRWPVLWNGIVGSHEIFHIFVILGALSHWWFVFERAGFPVIDEIVYKVIEHPRRGFRAHAIGERYVLQSDNLEDLKIKIREQVEEKFPLSVRPQHILLQFVKIDTLDL